MNKFIKTQTEFDTALLQLHELHVKEVANLRNEIHQLRTHIETARGELAHGRTTGKDWHNAALVTEEFLSRILKGGN